MKRLTFIAGIALICWNVNAWSADEAANFSGTWIPDIKKSDATPRMIMPVGNGPVGDVSRGGGMGGGMGMPGGGMGGPGGGMGMPGGGMGGPGGGMGGPGGKGAQQQPPQLLPMVIEQTEADLKITTKMKAPNGQEMPMIENYKLDGKDVVEMVPAPFSTEKVKKTTSTKLKKNKLQVKTETNNAPPAQGSTVVKKDYALSKDGKTLTVEVSTSGMFSSVQKLVYNKQ